MNEVVNPYIAGSPVTGAEMFFGREDVFEFIRQALTGQHRDHVIVLYGQRRTGKTSVLYQMSRHLSARYLCIFIDLHGLELAGIGGFLWELANSIARTLRRDYQIEIARPDRAEFAADARGYFENDFLNQVWQAIGDRHILLMLDEAIRLQEQVQAGKLEKEIFDYLRHLMQHHARLNFLFALGSGLEEMEKEYAFLFSVGLYKKISFFERETAAALITQPVKTYYQVAPAAVNRVLDVTSGHPYYTQLLCHSLFNRWQSTRKAQMDAPDVAAVLDEVVERGMSQLKFVWEDAAPAEQVVMAALAEATREQAKPLTTRQIREFLRKRDVPMPLGEIETAVKNLRAREVLRGDNAYQFAIDLQRLWTQQYKRMEWVKEESADLVRRWRATAEPPEPLVWWRRPAYVAVVGLFMVMALALTYTIIELNRARSQLQAGVVQEPTETPTPTPFPALATPPPGVTRIPTPTGTPTALPTPIRAAGITLTGKGVKVAVLASGIDASHPDLVGRIAGAKDFTGEGIQDGYGIGTYLAGLVGGTGAASNGRYAGLAPQSELYIAKVIASNGTGSNANAIAALEWAVQQNAKVALLALGSVGNCDGTDHLSQAVDSTVKRGVVVIVASGDAGPNPSTVGSPGCARDGLTVGYTGTDGNVTQLSSRGPTKDGRPKPDVVAPGERLIAPRTKGTSIGRVVDDNYTSLTGSSIAEAYVTGLVALMLEAEPALTPAEVKDILQKSAVKLGQDVNTQGAGRVDALAALAATRRLYRATWIASDVPPVIATDGKSDVSVTVRNDSTFSWRAGSVKLGYHWYDAGGREMIVREHIRTELPRDIQPGETVTLKGSVVAPPIVGRHTLRLDMLEEGVTWFAEAGSPKFEVLLDVAVATPTPAPTLAPTRTPTPPALPNTSLVFSSNRDGGLNLYRLDIASRRVERLTTDPDQSLNFQPNYSTRRDKIVFMRKVSMPIGEGNRTKEEWNLFTMGPQGQSVAQLTSGQFDNWHPAWSPNGEMIAFVSSRDQDNGELYLMRPVIEQLGNFGNLRRLTRQRFADVSPAWSPDNRTLVFASERDGRFHLYTLDIEVGESSVKQLTAGQNAEVRPHWSPDGRRIVFTRIERDTNADGKIDELDTGTIWMMDSDGRNPRNLTQSPFAENYATWSPDGRWIAFTRYIGESGKTEIFVMTADGRFQQNLSNHSADDWEPAWMVRP